MSDENLRSLKKKKKSETKKLLRSTAEVTGLAEDPVWGLPGAKAVKTRPRNCVDFPNDRGVHMRISETKETDVGKRESFNHDGGGVTRI